METTLTMEQEGGDRKALDVTLYKMFREGVLKRDEFKCVRCGATHKLEVHHMAPYNVNPVGALMIGNGITLCFNCHRKAGEGFHSIHGNQATETTLFEFVGHDKIHDLDERTWDMREDQAVIDELEYDMLN